MESSHRSPNFHSTHWSVVAAARNAEHPAQDEAIASLCERYWQPLYAFIRRSGHARSDAEDLTQGFFTQLLDKNYLADADEQRGRFRTFLLAAFKNYVANQRAQQAAQKRGGAVQHVSIAALDFERAETQYQSGRSDSWTPEALFERAWALSLLNDVLSQMEAEYEQEGKGALFAALKPTLTGGAPRGSYSELAEQLDTSTGAIKVAVHRLRKAYRLQLTKQIAATLGSDADETEVASEQEALFRALLGPDG